MEIEKLAKLARINLSSEEKEAFQKEFEAILGYISTLKEANVDGLENDFFKNKPVNEMRLDESNHEAGKFTKKLLEGSPFEEDGYIKVKHVFE